MKSRKVIVIGGGASGLMAAGRAARLGANVTLLEKMARPGLKLGITGKGRCNLTNITPVEESITHFGTNGRFLRQAFSMFFNDELISFFEKLGVPSITERGGRVFPQSGKAKDILKALVAWARSGGAEIRTKTAVTRLDLDGKKITGLFARHYQPGGEKSLRDIAHKGLRFEADAVIIATGGSSYPLTGSSGDGYALALSAGHRLIPVRPALVPLETNAPWKMQASGLKLRNVLVSLSIDGEKSREAFGELHFTETGVSGPVILTLSGHVVDCLDSGRRVVISIDLKPALDNGKLDNRIIRDLNENGKKQFSNILKELLPSKLIPICIDLTRIPHNKQAHQITSAERERLRMWLKGFSFRITGHLSFDEAIVTAGGVGLEQIDPRTMESRLVKGLYFAGEVMDLDGDTGGFNLQAAFSTGWVAGSSAADFKTYFTPARYGTGRKD